MSTFNIPGVSGTAVPAITFTPQGVVVPADVDVLAGVQSDINYAFGGGVNPALETPQGQLASSMAAIVSDKNSEILNICNQVDPQYAEGRFQDAIGRVYFLTRKGATSTVVDCIVGGLANTLIPAGTLARDTSGNTYNLLSDTTIPNTGSIVCQWANLSTGPIPCPANTLIQVYQAVPGWDTIYNPSDGSLGQNVETASEFEFRRKNSVALNGRGTTNAIYANVFQVADVLDCFVVDNPSGSTVNYGSTNYPLLPHSVYVAVRGGLDAPIAQAIWEKKDCGCDYNGDVSVTVIDPSGYSYPPPSYLVKFQRPASLPVKFQVQIVNSPSLPNNLTELVQNAIIARFNGTDGTSRERIGGTILASRYYGPVAAVGNNVVLLSVLVGIGSGAPNNPSVVVGIDQTPILNASDISVVLL